MSNTIRKFDTAQYAHPKSFEIAQSSKQYKQITEHIDEVLMIQSDFLVVQFWHDLSQLMTLENNAGWDSEENHRKKIDLLFQLQDKYQPQTNRFLS